MQRRALPVVLLVLCALALSAQNATSPSLNPASIDVIKAQSELERLRGLVQAGAVAPSRLAEAEDALGDAKDDEILRATLYGSLTAQDLSEQQAEGMRAAAQRRFDRQEAKLDRYEKLVDAGVLARNETEPLRLELESRRLTVDLADSRARLLAEIASQAHTEKEILENPQLSTDHRIMERFDGDGSFTPSDLKRVTLAFEAKFHRPLPISANGETSVHRALGFDHRGRVDVAVSPDAPEGVWLRSYLESRDIPFYAFRGAVAGKATGPHIHMGPGSTRLRAAD